MNRNPMLALGVGLIVSGSLVSSCKRSEQPVAPVAAGPVGAVPSTPSGSELRIAAGEQIVARDPKNLRAWIELGNDYFDTHQRQKAVDAYAKALELDPNNPDVLTDQGVMYRELGAYDKAVTNFQKANKINPRHMQSLFNLGVVYAYDLKDTDKATEVWNRLIETDPASPHAAQARQAIDEMKKRPAAR